MSSKVIAPDGTEKEVTNLGWLLRHWADVEWFEVHPYYGQYRGAWDCVLCAHLKDGRRYVTEFASREVLWYWLDRPKFQCLPVKWFGAVVPAGGLKYYRPDFINYSLPEGVRNG
jgi:hypothetical protein